MAIVTTYVCDATGKSGSERSDFVEVEIVSITYQPNASYSSRRTTNKKLVHIDLAKKLGIAVLFNNEVPAPEVTFEGKLKALLEDHVADLVENHLENR